MMERNGSVTLEPVLDLNQTPAAEQNTNRPLGVGDLCPKCGQGRLDYDGLLNLACPQCGYSLGGGCT
jgi:uncharacterized protein (DUF983 family)